jgi:hypothetical protein
MYIGDIQSVFHTPSSELIDATTTFISVISIIGGEAENVRKIVELVER